MKSEGELQIENGTRSSIEDEGNKCEGKLVCMRGQPRVVKEAAHEQSSTGSVS